MLFTALLTSLAINLALCVFFFTLYSILRKQPINFPVYAPRLLHDHRLASSPSNGHSLRQFIPSVSWVKMAWQLSEDDVFAISGLDGVVLIRIFIFSLRVFIAGVILGVFVLLPVNYFGTQLKAGSSSLTGTSVDCFSISNVNDGSSWLWVHFCAAYLFTGFVCYLLYYEYNYIYRKRMECFYASKPKSHEFTILVSGIPSLSGRTVGDAVENFFTEYHPSTFLSFSVVYKASQVHFLMKESKKLHEKISLIKSKHNYSEKTKRAGFWGIFGPKVTILDYYVMELEKLDDKIRQERSYLRSKEIPAAFVSFKSRYGAAVALRIQQGMEPTTWVTEEAPEPQDVHWPFFSTSFIERWTRKIVARGAYVGITILFLVPVVFVQSLANLNQLESLFPFLDGILRLKIVSQLVTGYLPSLILQFFLFLAPHVMILLSSFQGYTSYNQIERSACIKMLFFTIWNIFFANALSGSALYNVSIFLEPKKIPTVLADAVSSQASFFISYVVTSGWTSLSTELLRLFHLIRLVIQRINPEEDEFEVPSVPYHKEIPRLLFMLLLGVTYFFLAPLILPFILIYLCLGFIIYRNQLLNVYQPTYDTNGKYWRIVHNSTIFSLVLMHIIAIGIFVLKDLALASSLTIPLPIMTLLFNDYCSKRFGILFDGYSTESMLKKDRQEASDSSMIQFFNNLANAYEDPALNPNEHPESVENLTATLLQTTT